MKLILNAFSNVCPDLEWDRYTETETELNCYGWIKRTDGGKDFLVINFSIDETSPDQVWFVTSSAKYSQSFCDLTGGTHSPCKILIP